MDAATLLIAFVTVQRLAELPWARANERRLRAAGAHEVAGGHYPLIVAVHAGWLASLWALGPGRPVDLTLVGLFALVELMRLWTLASLGRRWTTRILVVPGETLVARGPYRFVRHPNYLVVIAEIALVPLALGLTAVALVFTLANAVVLTIRIRAEGRALAPARRACDSAATGL